MNDVEEVLDKVYELGYECGWENRDGQSSILGSGPSEPTFYESPENYDDWLAKLYGNLDLSNVVYGQLKHSRPLGDDTTQDNLYYVPDADQKGTHEVRGFLHDQLDLGSIAMGKTINHIEKDPAEAIDQLKERIRELEAENETLRATHPNGDVADDTAGWELDAESGSEATVPLKGDHVFNRAVIDYDLEVRGVAGEPGTVKCYVDIGNVKLVSDN